MDAKKGVAGTWAGPDKYLIGLLAICFIAHLGLSMVGWNNTLCDFHGFRQTQTAISAYYTIQEGFKLDYITPVLGKPWSIPMEFPLFQWIVAGVVMLTGMPLDQAGRLMSLLFFYLSFVPLYHLLRHMVADRGKIAVFFCIMLASPTYIFWSRTFMIETLALFLSLTYVAALVAAAGGATWWLLLLACVSGTLAALTKVTTFGVFLLSLPVILYLCGRLRAALTQPRIRLVAALALAVAVPLAAGAWWVHHSDQVKLLNPMTRNFLTSHALRSWNFGTLAQRLDRKLVVHMGAVAMRTVTWDVVAAAVFAVLFWMGRGGRLKSACLFGCFVAGPSIFFNLYVGHEYYWVANAVFMMLSVGFLVAAIMDDARLSRKVRLAVLPILLLLMYGRYFTYYYPMQSINNDSIVASTNAIKTATSPDEVLVIYGYQWNSEMCYYSQRKALMLWRPLTSEDVKEGLANLGDERIGAMVVGGEDRKDAALMEAGVGLFGVSPQPVFRGSDIDIYKKF